MSPEQLKKNVTQAEIEVEIATKRLNDAKYELAEATAVSWVAYFADHDWMMREQAGFQVIPISQETPRPRFIDALLLERFALLPGNPELIDDKEFRKVTATSLELADNSQRGSGWYKVVYVVFHTKAEAECAERKLREKFVENV
jgi:hypothetical protein